MGWLYINPDYNNGKHDACNGDAWMFDKDIACQCECICHQESDK